MDVGALSLVNDGINFILTSTYVYTGQVMVAWLKLKQSTEMVRALKPMVDRVYLYLHPNKGKEIHNRNVSDMQRQKGLFTT